jgi:microsomal dipeptidase-like Zn-dependent dipeptidase
VAALRAAGFSDSDVALICHGNWQRVLAAAWRA